MSRKEGQVYHDLPSLIPSGSTPCYFQLYFYDTDKEVENRLNVLSEVSLDKSIVEKLMEVLSGNPYSQVLRKLQHVPLDSYHIHIRSDAKLDQRVYNTPSADQVAAIWIEGNNPNVPRDHDIIVHSTSGHKHRVKHYYGCYDALQYPLLFPRGEVGWHQNIWKKKGPPIAHDDATTEAAHPTQIFGSSDDIFRQEQQGVNNGGRHHVSCRQYYCYKLQIRDHHQSILLLSGRLFQQYVVDMYIKLENTRLDYFRHKQSDIRAELYQGIVDSVLGGESRGSMVGKKIVLPASFVGGPRDMRRRYLDAISLVQKFGKPDLFITMTCNPDWKEIKDYLKDGQLAQDRPDLTARVFRAKLKDLKYQLFKKHIFGKVAAHVHVIEFQKRGLPHAHMLIILKPECKITSPDHFDKFVCAEIPDPDKFPDLYEKVAKHMMHGPCGVKAVKYLYKYIYKGHDKVTVHISNNVGDITIDEIQQFQDARWVSAQEAIWRIFEFELNEMYPAVINLQLHLPNKQFVSYWANQDLNNIIHSDTASRTMLTEFFNFCSKDKEKRKYLYREFPEYFVWNRNGKCWEERKTREALTSFADLLMYNDVQCSSFKEAAERRGLLQSDDWIIESLLEAASFKMPLALRQLFATVLVYCEPSDVRKLWDLLFEAMSEDFTRKEAVSTEVCLLKTLRSVDYFLDGMGRSIKDYDLPSMMSNICETEFIGFREVLDELQIRAPPEDISALTSLNLEQKSAYDIILDQVSSNVNGLFFNDGPGGTGKTHLYRALLATIRSKGMIAIATATSGVAASIMPGGRTSHSRFKIPIDGNESSVCNIPKQSGTAELLRLAKLIIWDEAPMAKQWAIEALDRSLRDIMSNDVLFGGKVIVFGGDFRQVLPVVPRGTRVETVNASLVMSYLWPKMQKLKLSKNMRAQHDSMFSDFLLRVGNGDEPTINEDLIQIPKEMVSCYEDTKHCEDQLINTIFPSLRENAHSIEYITKRAILATRNESVDMLNQKLISTFPGKERKYTSFDEAIDDTHNYYPEEFLNTLIPNGLPPHELVLKLNSPIMLLRNLNPSNGLCNGTRMVCKGFEPNIIHAEITSGQHAGQQSVIVI
ncbi:hypothetical protein RHGRI_003828 [Rhododendron griersonianum]|uniref:ATP-dependent DNA helicase n=1 Tax=Rhododendron griersonianum TaxID=479676 RepID=A0AAV6L6P4_9ERIC|nr:hypothetical protein RHGRI_003828 [Rhododendron griersonianum]